MNGADGSRRRVPRGQPSMARDTCHEWRGKLDARSCIQPLR